MKTTYSTLLLLSFFLSAAIATADEIDWKDDYQAAKADAKDQGKLVLVEFKTDS